MKADDETVPVPVAVVTSRIEAELIVGMLRGNGRMSSWVRAVLIGSAWTSVLGGPWS